MVVDVLPEVVYELVHLVVDMAIGSGIFFVRKHIISISAFYTVRPNAAHTITITPIIFFG